ncbi:hypothetical protein C8R43DRAFT_1033357 [Mycena crocata]|nr:hypothetical protein C8R43DRAFT_1033357 [Mycena crocata]
MTEFWYEMSMLWVGTFFYGIYLVLFCICIYILLHRPHDLANTILLATAISLFTLSTLQTILNLILGAGYIDGLDIPFEGISLADDMIYVVNNLIADGLVIYRCWIVWNRNIYVVAIPIIMLIVTSVFGWDILLPLAPFFMLTLATNVLVTSLTAGRIWWICRQARATLQTDLQKRYVSRIAIIVESGVIYSAFVLSYLIIGAVSSSGALQNLVVEMLRQVVGIVPTLIIVRVGLGVSVQNVESSVASAEALDSSTYSGRCHVLGVEPSRSTPYDLHRERVYDLEKGSGYSYGIGKPQGL